MTAHGFSLGSLYFFPSCCGCVVSEAYAIPTVGMSQQSNGRKSYTTVARIGSQPSVIRMWHFQDDRVCLGRGKDLIKYNYAWWEVWWKFLGENLLKDNLHIQKGTVGNVTAWDGIEGRAVEGKEADPWWAARSNQIGNQPSLKILFALTFTLFLYRLFSWVFFCWKQTAF